MREPHQIADTIGMVLAIVTVFLFLALASLAWHSDSPAPGLVFLGFSVLMAAAIHAERGRR